MFGIEELRMCLMKNRMEAGNSSVFIPFSYGAEADPRPQNSNYFLIPLTAKGLVARVRMLGITLQPRESIASRTLLVAWESYCWEQRVLTCALLLGAAR